MYRRNFLIVLTTAAVFWPPAIVVADMTPNKRIGLLADLVRATGELGDALKKLVDGVRHLVENGVDAYDAVIARSDFEELKKTSELISRQLATNEYIRISFGIYIDRFDQMDETDRKNVWGALCDRIFKSLENVHLLLRNMNEVHSDFSLEDAYTDISISLLRRRVLLEEVAAMDPPTTLEELDFLRKVDERYIQLINDLKKGLRDMNAFVKTLK